MNTCVKKSCKCIHVFSNKAICMLHIDFETLSTMFYKKKKK